jgi:uncharacterized coiled-coil DUF342 family protein
MSPGSGLEGTSSLYETMRRMERRTKTKPDYQLLDMLERIDKLREERRFLEAEIDRLGQKYQGTTVMIDEVQEQFRVDIGQIDTEIVELIGEVESYTGITMQELFKPV